MGGSARPSRSRKEKEEEPRPSCMGRSGISYVSYRVSHYRSLGQGEPRCGFHTKHQSIEGMTLTPLLSGSSWPSWPTGVSLIRKRPPPLGPPKGPRQNPTVGCFGALVLCIKPTSTPRPPRHQMEMKSWGESVCSERGAPVGPLKESSFIDNLLVRIHLIIVMISVDRPCAMGV